MINNSQDGYNSLIYNMVRNHPEYDLRSYKFLIDMNDDPPSDYYITHYSLNKKRVIYILWDGRLEFYQSGDPLYFENTEYYLKTYKKDRLNRKICEEYLLKAGINIYDDNFWKSDTLPYYFERIAW